MMDSVNSPNISLHYQSYLEKAISYVQYKNNFEDEIENTVQNPAADPDYKKYLLINHQRMKRVEKTYQPDQDLIL